MLHKQMGYGYILQELEEYKLNKIISFMINIPFYMKMVIQYLFIIFNSHCSTRLSNKK